MARVKGIPKRRNLQEIAPKKSYFATKQPFKKKLPPGLQDTGSKNSMFAEISSPTLLNKKIRKIQKQKKVEKEIIPRKTLQSLIRDISTNICPDLKFTLEALHAIHEATEGYMIKFFKNASKFVDGKEKKSLKLKHVVLLSLINKIRSVDMEPI